tara:strand:+ start:28182 stop:30068 length:1887 start_codon:yes stop_codon:yes gene_type:complete
VKSTHLVAVLPALGILWILDVPGRLGAVYITEQYLAVVLGLAVLGGVLISPLPRLWRSADLAFGVVTMLAWFWLAYNYQDWLLSAASRGPEKWLPALIALVGLVEVTRRACGGVLALLGLAFVAYGFLGWMAPGTLEGAYLKPARYLLYLYSDSNSVPGLVLNVGATQILGFIIFGATLNAVGGSDAMTQLALALMGHRRGGPAKVAILASSLFGTLSGSTVANVMSTGVVTIPMMKKSGYPARYAAAIEAVASNGGQIAPPVMGATAFVIAEFLQVGYADVVIAAFLPALFYYYLLYRQVDCYAVAHGITGAPRDSLPRLRAALKGSWPLLAPLGVLVWFLFVLGYSPGKSALYSSGAALALHLVTARHKGEVLALLPRILIESGRTLIPILLVCGVAGIIIGTINITGLGFSITLALGRIAEVGGVWALLLTTALLAIVLGVGMPTTGVYVVLSVLLAPALVRFGITPMAANLFILYFGLLSMLTPPVAIASYAAASIAGSDMWATGLTGMKLALTAYLLPFVFAMNPALLMDGTWPEIAVSGLTILVSGYLLAEVLAARHAFGGGLMRIVAGLVAVTVGGSTIFLAPASGPGIALALLSLPIVYGLTRLRGPAAPTPLAPSQKGS